MRTTRHAGRHFAPPHIKTMWMVFGGLLGVLLALTLRPNTGSIIAQEVDFSFQPSYLVEALKKGSSDLDVSSGYMKHAFKSYLQAHPNDTDALIAAIKMGIEDSATDRDSLYTRLIKVRLSHEDRRGLANHPNDRALSAFLLRELAGRAPATPMQAKQSAPMLSDNRRGGAVQPIKTIYPIASLVAHIAESAAQGEPENAYFTLFDNQVNHRTEDEKVFLRIAEFPGAYLVNRYYAEERAAIDAGMRKACGGVAPYQSSQLVSNITFRDGSVNSYENALGRAQTYEKQGDFRKAVAIRQGVISYALMLMQDERQSVGSADGIGLLLSVFPIVDGKDTKSEFAVRYAAYLTKHGFTKEAEWVKTFLGDGMSSLLHMDNTTWNRIAYLDAVAPLYWLGTQWLGIEVVLCLLLASLASAVAYRNRFKVSGIHSKKSQATLPLFAGALLALVPVLVTVELQQAMGTVPNVASLTRFQCAIAVLLGTLAFVMRRRMDLSKTFTSFLCSALLISLSMTFALGLMQSVAFWVNIRGGHLPEGYNHQQIFLGCWLATLVPVALVTLIGAGLSMRKMQRDNLAGHYANTLFPACMVFLTLFMLFIVKLDWATNRVSQDKIAELVTPSVVH